MKNGSKLNKYAKVALKASLLSSDGASPVKAWKAAAAEVFAAGKPSAEKKGCPKNAFLGLAEAGLIKGIAPGQYTRSVENRQYAESAVRLLHEDASWSERPDELWSQVAESAVKKKHNGQIDVVLALWNTRKLVGQDA